MGIRKRRRALRVIMQEGLEAALCTDADMLEACRPKTPLGRLVRGLILEATKCKATPLKVVMSLLNEEPVKESEDASEMADEPAWDWSPEGVWRTMPEPEAASAPAPADDVEGPAKKELVRRLNRLIETGQRDHAMRIIDGLRTDAFATPEPAFVPTG